MCDARSRSRVVLIAVLAIGSTISAGCKSPQPGGFNWARPKHCLDPAVPPPPVHMPRELSKVALPEYVIEPPDILLIDAVKIVPKPPYRIESLDVLALQVGGALPDRPIEGSYAVEPGGAINLGPPYGTVQVAGMELSEAREAIRRHLVEFLQEPEVALNLLQTSGMQQIAGEHLVGPDGKVTLGTYGKVYVTGMTQEQAREAIEAHLSKTLEDPKVSVDLFAYNSKVYYIVTQGAGLGDGVARFPITGNETVLDAIANVNGLESVSSKRIWIARPAPHLAGQEQVLPVDWVSITQRGATGSNYQVLPGDRIYIAQDRLVATDTAIGKIVAPAERVFGFALLGGNSVRFYKFFHRSQGTGIGQ